MESLLVRSRKSVVFANINEHVLTTTDNPLEAWDELFQVNNHQLYDI